MCLRELSHRLKAFAPGFAIVLAFTPVAWGAPLQLSPTRIVIPERGALTGYILRTASNTVAFLPPDRWKTDRKSDQVIMMAPDMGAALTLQVFDNLHRTNGWNWAEVRRQLAERWKDARIVREFDCYASDSPGKAYDMEETGAKGAKITRRVAVVPFSSGVIEVSLAAPRSRFPAASYFFGTLMSSLRFTAPGANH